MNTKALIILFFISAFTVVGCNNDSDDCIDESKIDPAKACIEIYDPVCGCDGKTYSNTCFAEGAGVTKWTEGACEDS